MAAGWQAEGYPRVAGHLADECDPEEAGAAPPAGRVGDAIVPRCARPGAHRGVGRLVLAARSFADMLDVPPETTVAPTRDGPAGDDKTDSEESDAVGEEFDRWVNMMLYAADRLAEMARHDPELIAAAAASTASAEDQLWKGILRLASIRSAHGPEGPRRHIHLVR